MRTVIDDGFTVAGKVYKKGEQFQETLLPDKILNMRQQRELYGRVWYVDSEKYIPGYQYNAPVQSGMSLVSINTQHIDDEEEVKPKTKSKKRR
jgi:hypothetical protein